MQPTHSKCHAGSVLTRSAVSPPRQSQSPSRTRLGAASLVVIGAGSCSSAIVCFRTTFDTHFLACPNGMLAHDIPDQLRSDKTRQDQTRQDQTRPSRKRQEPTRSDQIRLVDLLRLDLEKTRPDQTRPTQIGPHQTKPYWPFPCFPVASLPFHLCRYEAMLVAFAEANADIEVIICRLASGGGGGGRGGRGFSQGGRGTCFKCGESGHWANACPRGR